MESFTICVALGIPTPWPGLSSSRAIRQVNKDHVFELWFSRTGRIEAVVLDGSGEELIAETISPVIEVEGEGFALIVFLAAFDGGSRSMNIRIDNCDVKSDDEPLHIVAGPDPATTPVLNSTVDQPGNEAALKKRKQRLASYRDEGLSPEQEEQRWDDLCRELRLLDQAATALYAGNFDHVVTVSVHLRKIVGSGKGNHLLQDCASFDGRALPVFERPAPPSADWTPDQIEGSDWHEWDAFSPSAIGFCSHQTDLDTWLGRRAGTIGGERLSHKAVLHAIADKIGAHSDLTRREVVEALEKLSVGRASALAHYLIEMTKGVLAVATILMDAKYGTLSAD